MPSFSFPVSARPVVLPSKPPPKPPVSTGSVGSIDKIILPNKPPVSTESVFPNSLFPDLNGPLDFIPSGIMPIRPPDAWGISRFVNTSTEPTTLQPESQPTTLQPESQSQPDGNIDPSVYMIAGGFLIVAFILFKK